MNIYIRIVSQTIAISTAYHHHPHLHPHSHRHKNDHLVEGRRWMLNYWFTMFSIFDHLAKHAPGGEGIAWRNSRHGSLSSLCWMPWSPLNRLLKTLPVKLASTAQMIFWVLISYTSLHFRPPMYWEYHAMHCILSSQYMTALTTVKKVFKKCVDVVKECLKSIVRQPPPHLRLENSWKQQ